LDDKAILRNAGECPMDVATEDGEDAKTEYEPDPACMGNTNGELVVELE
jgi:hypothetical protein